MRKKLFLIIGISFVLFAGCKQLLDDIEKDFKYWSSSTFIAGMDISSVSIGTDEESYPCIPSDGDKTIAIKLSNSQNYVIKTPQESGAPSDIIRFGSGTIGSGSGGVPEYGTDYTLIKNGFNELKLTLKETFLKKNECGAADLDPAITLYNKEGRKFGTHSFKLRVNTPPKIEYKAIAKTEADTSGNRCYVLCLKVNDMDKKAGPGGTELLHKDLVKLLYSTSTENNVSVPISVKET